MSPNPIPSGMSFPASHQRCPEITAIFCLNDEIALGAMTAASDMAALPQIFVIGFGDSRRPLLGRA